MKFGGHQSFHLRDQWLSKGIRYIKSASKNFSNEGKPAPSAMEELGVGKNMAESIKYWLKATKLIESAAGGFVLSETAQKILKKDPYFELDGTLFLIHYLLAGNKNEGTAWHWFFNCFSAMEFDRESLKNQFSAYIQIQTNKTVKDKTLEKDLNCLLRMYQAVEWTGKKNPETETPSPFTKYGWLEKRGEGFIRNKLNIADMNVHIFAFILYIFWKEGLNRTESVPLEDFFVKENSPGRIFCFSPEEMSDLVDMCSKEDYLDYSRTGGYFIVRPDKNRLKKALDNYYREMNLPNSYMEFSLKFPVSADRQRSGFQTKPV